MTLCITINSSLLAILKCLSIVSNTSAIGSQMAYRSGATFHELAIVSIAF